MDCKLLKNITRRIAESLLSLAIVPGLAFGAETTGIRISAPSLGWVLAPDGSQVIEITGVAESPRMGRSIALPASARHAWASPDAASVILQLDAGLFLSLAGSEPEALTEIPAGTAATVAWDRASDGFAVCWDSNCETRGADGVVRSRWDVVLSARVLAYSASSGAVIVTADGAEWRRGAETLSLDFIPVAAAFRPASQELWLLDSAGHLTGQDFQGRRTGETDLIPDAVGLTASADGKAFFAASAEGAAAAFTIAANTVDRLTLEDSVEGVWAAPGAFTARLHDSAKRAIAIWNGDAGQSGGAIGWVPAAVTEVRQ